MKKKLVVFSGAGMSAESGIGTFRDAGGLWEQYNIEDVATPEAWKKNPDLVTDFYNQRRKQVIEAVPNSAHLLIASLEKYFVVHVVTQNIDDLHERAGSSSVLHLHGNIRLAKSSGPNQEDRYYPIEGWELTANDKCPDGFPLRPHVVWFGEQVPALNDAAKIIQEADILVVVGTSLQVYPAAGLVHLAPGNCKCYVIDPNSDEFEVPSNFIKIKANASEGMRELIQRITD
ncbi:MAG: NAD-dependent deacylase [Flavobacteriales bacterium]|nr:NAD-dependent deacylase [Flavobacteriales bacterium]